MMKNDINILFTIDKNYVQHLTVTILSLLENNKQSKFNIFVFSDYIPDDDFVYIKDTVEKYGSKISKIIISKEKLETYPMSNDKASQYSVACYYRLLMAELLPADIDKIIYMDCDLLVRTDIHDFWNIDIDRFVLAAIDDAWFTTYWAHRRLDIPAEYGYFNAGVLLVNLKRWREQSVTSLLLNYIENNKEKILLQDQDVLNAVLYKDRFRLPMKWNVLECFIYFKFSRPGAYAKREAIEAAKSPGIIHWATNFKPWMYGSYNPYKKEYYKYLRMTKWKDYKPSFDVIKYKFGTTRAICVLLHIDKYIQLLIPNLYVAIKKPKK